MLGGPRGQCCPVCSENFLGSALKFHIKTCARTMLAQLASCPHCGRPVRRDDLREHAQRCKLRWADTAAPSNQEKSLFQAKTEGLREALRKIECGDLCSLDKRGCFVCSVCGQQGLGLGEIVPHETKCRQRLSVEGRVPIAQAIDAAPAPAERLRLLLCSLKDEIGRAAEGDPSATLELCLERLRDVCRNACYREERKYRRLRRSNQAFSEAIGRWAAGVQLLEAVGFQSVVCAAKTGSNPEPHLLLEEQMPEATLQEILGVLDEDQPAERRPSPPPTEEPSSSSKGMLEECSYCKKHFRFDRIAKHETRCMAAKPKPRKFDVVRNLLGGTPAEPYIPQVRQDLASGIKLPPLQINRSGGDGPVGLEECSRCGRSFAPEALEKHSRSCKGATPRQTATPRAGSRPQTPSGTRPQTPSSTRASTGRPKTPLGASGSSSQAKLPAAELPIPRSARPRSASRPKTGDQRLKGAAQPAVAAPPPQTQSVSYPKPAATLPEVSHGYTTQEPAAVPLEAHSNGWPHPQPVPAEAPALQAYTHKAELPAAPPAVAVEQEEPLTKAHAGFFQTQPVTYEALEARQASTHQRRALSLSSVCQRGRCRGVARDGVSCNTEPEATTRPLGSPLQWANVGKKELPTSLESNLKRRAGQERQQR